MSRCGMYLRKEQKQGVECFEAGGRIWGNFLERMDGNQLKE